MPNNSNEEGQQPLIPSGSNRQNDNGAQSDGVVESAASIFYVGASVYAMNNFLPIVMAATVAPPAAVIAADLLFAASRGLKAIIPGSAQPPTDESSDHPVVNCLLKNTIYVGGTIKAYRLVREEGCAGVKTCHPFGIGCVGLFAAGVVNAASNIATRCAPPTNQSVSIR